MRVFSCQSLASLSSARISLEAFTIIIAIVTVDLGPNLVLMASLGQGMSLAQGAQSDTPAVTMMTSSTQMTSMVPLAIATMASGKTMAQMKRSRPLLARRPKRSPSLSKSTTTRPPRPPRSPRRRVRRLQKELPRRVTMMRTTTPTRRRPLLPLPPLLPLRQLPRQGKRRMSPLPTHSKVHTAPAMIQSQRSLLSLVGTGH
mmetsp:Transcript_36457/g.54954  ORF Transcript_36457/g.54954 Transcript_36457/m.54954 type:complete len:201 (+) Transcript_36457:125-727(+)